MEEEKLGTKRPDRRCLICCVLVMIVDKTVKKKKKNMVLASLKQRANMCSAAGSQSPTLKMAACWTI